MKTVQIIMEEFKNAGIEVLEENAKTAIEVLFGKVIPRLATEADEPVVKTIAGVVVIASPAIESSLLKMADQINKEDNA